jgi:hypothetical protein
LIFTPSNSIITGEKYLYGSNAGLVRFLGHVAAIIIANNNYHMSQRADLWNGSIGSMWTTIADPGISQQKRPMGHFGHGLPLGPVESLGECQRLQRCGL